MTHMYENVVATLTTNSVSTSSEELLAQNSKRVGMMIQNNGPDTLYINFDATATTAHLQIDSGQSLEFFNGVSSQVTGISGGTSAAVIVSFGG